MIDLHIAVVTANTIATTVATIIIAKSIIIVMLITTHQLHMALQQVQLDYTINHITHCYSAFTAFFHRYLNYHSYYSHTFSALINRIAGCAIAACIS